MYIWHENGLQESLNMFFMQYRHIYIYIYEWGYLNLQGLRRWESLGYIWIYLNMFWLSYGNYLKCVRKVRIQIISGKFFWKLCRPHLTSFTMSFTRYLRKDETVVDDEMFQKCFKRLVIVILVFMTPNDQ